MLPLPLSLSETWSVRPRPTRTGRRIFVWSHRSASNAQLGALAVAREADRLDVVGRDPERAAVLAVDDLGVLVLDREDRRQVAQEADRVDLLGGLGDADGGLRRSRCSSRPPRTVIACVPLGSVTVHDSEPVQSVGVASPRVNVIVALPMSPGAPSSASLQPRAQQHLAGRQRVAEVGHDRVLGRDGDDQRLRDRLAVAVGHGDRARVRPGRGGDVARERPASASARRSTRRPATGRRAARSRSRSGPSRRCRRRSPRPRCR